MQGSNDISHEVPLLLLAAADGEDTAGPTAVRRAGWGTWEGGGRGKSATKVMMSSSKLYNY